MRALRAASIRRIRIRLVCWQPGGVKGGMGEVGERTGKIYAENGNKRKDPQNATDLSFRRRPLGLPVRVIA